MSTQFASFDTTVLSLHGVEKRYGRESAVRIDEFSVHIGDMVAVHGPSASGKSTLLRMLARITQPSEGAIRYTPESAHWRISYLAQSGGVYPQMTLRENIALWARLYGLTEPRNPAQLWFVESLGLDNALDTKIDELSTGYRRLSALACTLAAEPHAILWDEPFSNLDSEKQGRVAEVIAQLRLTLRFSVIAVHESAQAPFANRQLHVAGRISA
jgi:ABC-type multidrug transport system ATPase subunit